MVRSAGVWLAVLFLTGCARSPISEPLRKAARKDISFGMVQQNPRAYEGSLVVWGGEVIRTVNTAGGTLLYVLETPLAGHERPRAPQYAQGRFIAETARFLDPAVFKPGARVTIAGTVEGARAEQIGQIVYSYPVLHLDQIAVWERRAVTYAPSSDWEWGWYGPSCYWDWDCGWQSPWAWNWEWDWSRPELDRYGWGGEVAHGHD